MDPKHAIGPRDVRPSRRRLPDRVRTARVLIVDDVASNLVLLDRVIRSAGLSDVHTLGDPRRAVQLCAELKPDLLVLDLHMPHVDGFAIMSAVRAAAPAAYLPILALTADTSKETLFRALEAGATDFVQTPFVYEEVVLRVGNLLQSRRLYSDVHEHNSALRAQLERSAANEQRRLEERLARIGRIDAVLAGDAIRMVFQPIVDLHDGTVRGFEALARFVTEPQRPPDQWFREADTVGRGVELELAAVRAALADLDRLPAEVFVSANVSPKAVLDPRLGQLLSTVPGERVVLELTEHVPVDDYEAVLAMLTPLRAQGVRVAVDDVGAGYAGLRHVLRVRPDILKLDIDLTSGIDADPAKRALASAILTFAGEIDATVIAEGIETSEELEALRGLGFRWGQGYRLARPVPVGDVATLEAVTSTDG